MFSTALSVFKALPMHCFYYCGVIYTVFSGLSCSSIIIFRDKTILFLYTSHFFDE